MSWQRSAIKEVNEWALSVVYNFVEPCFKVRTLEFLEGSWTWFGLWRKYEVRNDLKFRFFKILAQIRNSCPIILQVIFEFKANIYMFIFTSYMYILYAIRKTFLVYYLAREKSLLINTYLSCSSHKSNISIST